jgi:hypothetical protein
MTKEQKYLILFNIKFIVIDIAWKRNFRQAEWRGLGIAAI